MGVEPNKQTSSTRALKIDLAIILWHLLSQLYSMADLAAATYYRQPRV